MRRRRRPPWLWLWFRLSHFTLSKKPNKGATRSAIATVEDCNKLQQIASQLRIPGSMSKNAGSCSGPNPAPPLHCLCLCLSGRAIAVALALVVVVIVLLQKWRQERIGGELG